MKAAGFTYHAPRELAEAVALLAEHAPDGGRILAGGQSLAPMMALRLAQPPYLIDINRLPGLDRVTVADGMLRIPACVRHAAFERDICPGPLGPLLRRVAGHVAHWPIRTRGTFCGSIAHADPASEWCLVAIALGGTAVARGPRGVRTIPASALFTGVMQTALADDEMLTEMRLPLLPDGTRWGFHEISRRAGDYAMAAALVTFRQANGRIMDARMAVGGAEPSPRRIPAAEAELMDTGRFDAAADAAAAAVAPMEDGQVDAAFRRDLVRAATRRALAAA